MFESFSHHINNNELFRNYCNNQGFSLSTKQIELIDYPYLPVNIFKNKKLYSVPNENINVILSSSATSGIPSMIGIDSVTSKRQTMASAKVMSNYLGDNRRPFLILDENPLISNSVEISARAAATRGFLILASEPKYFLINNNDRLSFDIDKFQKSINSCKEKGQEVCVFGFTYVLYHHVVKELMEKNIQLNLPENSKVAHIGGWKKLESEKVSKKQFVKDISNLFGVKVDNIYDFYGFTEQMGLLYVSVGDEPKTVSTYSEIIIRDFQTLEPVKDGEQGLIQILTPLPHSYPGISVLTEDVGKIVDRGIDNTGRIGTKFEMIGRAKEAETRGCGDIMADYIA
jgi:phenylacetate-coenzyme A ligase PaaK-like adenylate-forming protein